MKKVSDLPIELQEKLNNFVKKILSQYNLDSVVVIGVWALDEVPDGEEITLVIISDDFSHIIGSERANLIYKYWEPPPTLNAFHHTRMEFIKLLKRRQEYAFEAIERGIIIYDNGFFKKIREAFDLELKQFKVPEESIWDLY